MEINILEGELLVISEINILEGELLVELGISEINILEGEPVTNILEAEPVTKHINFSYSNVEQRSLNRRASIVHFVKQSVHLSSR